MSFRALISRTVRQTGHVQPVLRAKSRTASSFSSRSISDFHGRHAPKELSRLRSPALVLSRSKSDHASPEAAALPDRLSTDPARYQIPQLRTEGEEDPRKVPAPKENERGEVPAYELTFTCKPCKTRSAHRISKHGYHNGTVLITCPNCKNRHVISDHLKIFNDTSKSFEQILRQKKQELKLGVLDGDFEMWDDGTQTARDKNAKGTPIAGATRGSSD